MAKKESQKSLDSWTKEEWGTKSGKNSTQGKNATGERYLPKKARESLSDQEYARSTRKESSAASDVYKRQASLTRDLAFDFAFDLLSADIALH